MGSKPASVVALSTMVERGWVIRYVVVSRKMAHPWISGPTLEEAANSYGIPVVTQPELPRVRVDLVISYMFRYRVKSDVIALGRRAAVNFHAGPLPEFGGWAFYNMAILENSREYGCTCHHLDDGFDTGPLLRVSRFPIDAARETAFSLERRTQEDMLRLFLEFCDLVETTGTTGTFPREEQDPAKMRYLDYESFAKLKEIPAGADAETIDRHARAFWYPPYECACINVGGTKVEVVPEIAKEQLAQLLHADDYARLLKIAETYAPASAVLSEVEVLPAQVGSKAA